MDRDLRLPIIQHSDISVDYSIASIATCQRLCTS